MKRIIKSLLISMLAIAMLSACGGGTDEDNNLAAGTGSGSEGSRTSSSTSGSSIPTGNASASVFWSIPTTRESGNALPLNELAGYIIFLGNQPGNYLTSVIVRNATQTNYTFSGIAQGNYYLAVRAFDNAGQISQKSEVLKQAR